MLYLRLVGFVILLFFGCSREARLPQESAERLFALEVKPLLAAKCFACHGQSPGAIEGGLALTTREAMLRGGASAQAALVPGDAEASLLYAAVRHTDAAFRMPPKENDRLTEGQVGKIRAWIDAGAPWPDAAAERRYLEADRLSLQTPEGVRVATSGGLSDAWTNRRYRAKDLWAFRPVGHPTPPAAEADHPVDAFLNRRLAAAGLAPAPRTSKRALLRRAAYDLTGLPPRPEDVAAFLNDDSPDAWSRAVDRMLASPQYGEQWARHWLDVVRYADTSGYANDWERSNAWRYRDYVVRAFNADKPYDRFVLEQLAGDILDPSNPEMLVATGYLRMGPWEHTAMSQVVESRQLYLDDVTDSVGQTFLSVPLRCAKCHDHKVDPIPTRDYYRFYSVFATTQLAERLAAFLPEENRNTFGPERARIEKLLRWAETDVAKIKAKEERAARVWCAERGIPYQPRDELKAQPEDRKPPRHIGLTLHDQGYLKVRSQDAEIWRRRLERYQTLAHSVYEGPDTDWNSIKLRIPGKDQLHGDPPESFILKGGSVYAPGARVTPGVLSAIPVRFNPGEPRARAAVPSGMAGRRLALARWIASPDNPLATRSIVNRVWQYHFGRGLTGNANNFGKMAKKPTHPDLLDWLARRFVAEGWSLKALHRLLMTSQAYQRSDRPPDREAVEQRDSGNELLSFFPPRRLTAEEIRDAMLAASGELNLEVGGLPVFPEVNPEFAAQPRMNQATLTPAYQPSRTRAQRNRRSLYVYRMRMQTDPFFEVFNQPSYDLSCERRDSSTVAPQAFTLMNSGNSTDRSIAMALRLQEEADAVDSQIDRAFQLAFGRPASERERARTGSYVQRMEAYHARHPPQPVLPPRELDRTVVEEMSGLALHYKEPLDAYDAYEPHAQAWEVDPATRALADLCLILFNGNEFVYVY